ncbi:uncharacterized protein LOC127009124 [Eriocheir sinensis]|uniref:uncharacterized protein LOC127009124 n=1 Tax=Eriocheir sinensis TaxID=95602 RepID=UPI0021C5CD41|nr:uncharacterized protein LOC127009124 [Eriocheir sinensis]
MKITAIRGGLAWALLLVGVAAAAPSIPEGVEGLPGKVEGVEELQVVEEEQEEEGGRYKRITATDREGKMFVLRWQIRQMACTTQNTTQSEGTCLPFNDCDLNGGITSGTCSSGFASCCLLQRTCGGSTRYNNTYFVNPGFSDADTGTGSCTLNVNRINNDICQLRLDFLDFELEQPDAAGNCITDYLSVSPSPAPQICGTNSGQHMYINVQSMSGPVQLMVDRSAASTAQRRWNIKVAQIPCSSQFRAPNGCLQYFTGTSGNVRSFNYDESPSARDAGGVTGTRQIANNDYGVCVEMAEDNCGIVWTRNTSGGQYGYSVSGNANMVLRSIIGTRDASSIGDQCTTDYVLIPGGKTDTGEQVDRLCGLGFPDAVVSTTKPFAISMGGNWRGLLVVWAVVIGSALSFSVISQEDEGQELLQQQAKGEGLIPESHREDKVLFVFAQVQAVECNTNGSSVSTGTCLTSGDCADRGGTASGSCSDGFGVCCVVTRSCNQETTINNTYFQEPDTVSTLGACSLTVNRINKNICQIRLDFLQHDLSQPDADGTCTKDFMLLSGGISNLPKVCGTITGQHMYYDLDPNGGAVKVTVDRASTASLTTAWNIKISQIPCDSKYRAPVGCLQYYTETTNVVKSFNYDGVPETHGTQQLAGMEYAVCIRRADNYCGITWVANTDSDPYSFTMTDNAKVVEESTLGTRYVSTRGNKCISDFVVIPGGLYTTDGNVMTHSDRYCGLGFPNSVSSTSKPFALYVKSDTNESTDLYNRGFSLTYRQTSCS